MLLTLVQLCYAPFLLLSLNNIKIVVEALASDTISIPRACVPPHDSYDFCNPNLNITTRVANLISLLNNEEKANLLIARNSPRGNISRLGIPEYDWGGNCIHGVQSRCGNGTDGEERCPTSFPNPNHLGATFNRTIWHQLGSIIGVELRSLWLQGVGENHPPTELPHIGLDCWSPNVGIVRDARWGRNLETPGEDPYLNGQFGTQYSLGLQNNPEETRFIQAVVTLKHFDANSLEGDWVGPGSEAKYPGSGCPGKICTRHTVDPNISLYDLASTYLPAFKSSVMEGGALGVMCSYNSINGVPSCANEWLLETQLRKQWNFEGYVTGDSGAVKDIATSHFYTPDLETACIKAVSAGCDIESAPWKSGQPWATGGPYAEFLPQAIQKGTLDMKILDLAVARSVSLRFRMGLFDPIEDQPLWNISKDVVHSTQHVAAAFESTDQGLVLLQNPSGLLPFDPSLSTAIIGPQSLSRSVLVGNYLGQICPGLDSKGGENFDCVENLAEAVANLTSAAPIIVEGLEKVTSMNESQFKKAIDAAKVSKQVIMFLGNDGTVEGEGHDRHEVTLPGAQQHLFDVVYQVNRNIVVVLLNGGAIAIDKIKSSDVGIIEAWYPGIYGASSVARSIFGKTNRWGKLPITIYSESQANSFDMLNFDMGSSPGRTYRYFTGKPLWNFGHGLSYSKFNLSHSASNSQKIFNLSRDGLPLSIRIRVQNVGEVEGDEVVMAYFKPATTTLPSGAPASKIVKQLFDFQRVQLNSGESTDLAFVVSANTLPLFDENGNRVLFPGLYELIFTNGVEQTVTVSVNITGASPQIIELLNPVTKM